METKKIEKTEEEWKEDLTPEEYSILRHEGTEPPFIGKFVENHEAGIYHCKACGAPLFSSEEKFDSGSGWPSFTAPISDDCVLLRSDKKLLLERTEIVCAVCGSHHGHVFLDGPGPTGKRYCTNSLGLTFEKN